MHCNVPATGKSWIDNEFKFDDLETLLAMSLDSHAPLIALGRPGEQVGAGRCS
jgi:hypothetical protein